MTAVSTWWVHTAAVETYLGSGPRGDAWSAPAALSGWMEDVVELVRGTDGQEVVSSGVWRGPLSDAGKLVPGSKVNGRRVISLARFDSASLNLGLDHCEARLL